MAIPVMELPDGSIKYSDGTIKPKVTKPVSRNLFDFWNIAISAPKQTKPTDQQMMDVIFPKGTVRQQMSSLTTPSIPLPATKKAVQEMSSKPMFSDSTKLALWKQH